MSRKVPPKPSILDEQEFYKIIGGKKVWRSPDKKRYYTWDSLHGEVEVFTSKGKHLGSIDPSDGKYIKPAVKGREIDV